MMAVIALGGDHEHVDWAHASTLDWAIGGVVIVCMVAVAGFLVWALVKAIRGQYPFGDDG